MFLGCLIWPPSTDNRKDTIETNLFSIHMVCVMQIGVSSSCFYPLETEKSLIKLGELGVKKAEIFVNSSSELQKSFISEICKIKDFYSIDILSFHPFTSFGEGFYIFSEYYRRFLDSLEMYKPMFEAAKTLGAEIFVLHGAKNIREISDEEYAERFLRFCNTAKDFGITVAHENVVDYVGQTPQFMKYLQNRLGENFKMVLDIKQARRAKQDPYEFIEAVGESIVHLHLSDFTDDEDCKPPFENGKFDFQKLFEKMNGIGYKGNAVIEVYRHNFKEAAELGDAMHYLQNLLRKH